MSKYTRVILITGAAGFIGSNVAVLLATKYPNYHIIGLDSLQYVGGTLKNLAAIEKAPNFTFVKGDIASTDFLRYIMKTDKVDTILHFAAQSHVDSSFGNSLEFTKTNTLGTHALLEVSRTLGSQLKMFLYASTDEVYAGNDEQSAPFHEVSMLSPLNPYAASKAAGEMFLRSYFHSFKLPVIITRQNNAFGPYQYPEWMIPKFVHLISSGGKCCLHGDGSHSRSFLYIDDVSDAYDTLIHKGHVGETYNIGVKDKISNKDVAKRIISLMKPEVKDHETLIEYVKDRTINDNKRFLVEYEKIHALGWSTKVSFEEGLKRTIAWNKENPHHFGDVSGALVPHPLISKTGSTVIEALVLK